MSLGLDLLAAARFVRSCLELDPVDGSRGLCARASFGVMWELQRRGFDAHIVHVDAWGGGHFVRGHSFVSAERSYVVDITGDQFDRRRRPPVVVTPWEKYLPFLRWALLHRRWDGGGTPTRPWRIVQLQTRACLEEVVQMQRDGYWGESGKARIEAWMVQDQDHAATVSALPSTGSLDTPGACRQGC